MEFEAAIASLHYKQGFLTAEDSMGHPSERIRKLGLPYHHHQQRSIQAEWDGRISVADEDSGGREGGARCAA